MSIIDELLENDQNTLKETATLKPEPQKTNFTPSESNGRFSVDDAEEITEEFENDFFGEESAPIMENDAPDNTAQFLDENQHAEIETMEELSEEEKRRNFLFAEMRVQMFSMAGAMGCQWLSGEWGEEFESKYTPSKAKQKELARSIAEVMNIEMKRRDPRTTMYEMFAVVFAPLLFAAAQTGFRNKKKKKEAAAKMRVVKKYGQPATAPNPENFAVPMQPVQQMPTPEQPAQQTQPQPEVKKDLMPVNRFDFVDADDKATAQIESELIPISQTVSKTIDHNKKKETRGRKAGSKRNPKTKKMEQPVKIENGLMYYSWGETKRVPKPKKSK